VQVCGWKAWSNLPVFYTWETGPNNWNRFIGLKDSGNIFVNFEAPLQIKYVHHQPDAQMPDRVYDGNTFMLEYGGFGQMNGIPSFCVNMDTGDKVDCSQSGGGSNSIRWVPQFTIPSVQPAGAPLAGSLTEVTDSNNTKYFVKPLEIEQRMILDMTAGACNTLASTSFSGYSLPGIGVFAGDAFFTNASAGNPEPAVSSAPAVIGGVVQ
jgi:hypothetical protein